MKKIEYLKRIRDNIKGYLPPKYNDLDIHIISRETNKGNRNGLHFRQNSPGVEGNIYLDEYYDTFPIVCDPLLKELSEEICTAFSVATFCEEPSFEKTLSPTLPKIDFDDLRVYEHAKKKLVIKMRSDEYKDLKTDPTKTEKWNEYFYKDIYLSCDDSLQTLIPISEDLFQSWDISIMQLFEDAQHTMRARGIKLWDPQVLNEHKNLYEDPCITKLQSMYGVSSKAESYGAFILTDEEILCRISMIFGCDYFILPSSVAELMVCPETALFNRNEQNYENYMNISTFLLALLLEGNHNLPEPQYEFLSNHLFHYSITHGVEECREFLSRINPQKNTTNT